MTTITTLCKVGTLARVDVPLSRRENREREIYACEEFREWVANDLPAIQSLDSTNLTPREQLVALTRAFITGKPMHSRRLFKQLTPLENDVFELKTPDLRVFGWIYRKDVFIAVTAKEIEPLKTHNLYPGYVGMVVRKRLAIDLDEPKWRPGAKAYELISD